MAQNRPHLNCSTDDLSRMCEAASEKLIGEIKHELSHRKSKSARVLTENLGGETKSQKRKKSSGAHSGDDDHAVRCMATT